MKKMIKFYILLIFLVSNSFSQTFIPPGDVSGTWAILNSPYYIQGDITIPNDSTLTIEPGVLVEFQGYYALNVQGRLLAVGTGSNKIEFTVNDTTGFHNQENTLGGWNGIQFVDTPAENDTSKIVYCKMQFGKAVGSNVPDKAGGAIYIGNFNKVLIANCIITNNSAGGSDSPSGGGIALALANITLENNLISNNSAWDGGGIQIWESNIVFRNNIISYNKADEGGGGIWIGGQSTVVFNNDSIVGNVAVNNGGGMVCWQASNTNLDSVVLSNNIANWGGCIAVFSGELTMDRCLLSDNGASNTGGGLSSESGTIQINNTVFEGDTATAFGGAIAAYSSELSLSNCYLNDNGTGIRGGGIHSNFSNLNISNTTFERDTANIFGGAIATEHTEMFLNYCNLIDNSARILGGGIHSDYSTVDISNTTFERDTTEGTGGGIFTWQSSLNIEGSEFLNNSALNNGGAVSSSNCHVFIDSCTFYQNLAGNEAGAIECFIDTSFFTEKLSIQINNSEFLNNSSGNLFAGVKIRQDNSDTALCSVRMDNNLFKDNTAYSYSAIRFIGNIDNIIVSNSIFDNNYNYSPIFHSIFSANGGAKVKVNNSVFTKNYPRATSLNINARIDFMNCTFANNYGANSAALSLRNNAESTITNSILWNNGDTPVLMVTVASNENKLTVNYSDIQFGSDSISVSDSLSIVHWGIGNIIEDPLFADTLNNDFHLQDLSPCIATGIDSIEIAGLWYYAPLTDIEGNPRPFPVGTMPDMGAYESQYPVKVENINLNLPDEYILYQNYPNPFNPSTKISWHQPVDSKTTLKVFDVLGNEVATLVDEYKPAGIYEVEFNVAQDSRPAIANGISFKGGYASGVYFYQLKTGNFIKIKKMLILK